MARSSVKLVALVLAAGAVPLGLLVWSASVPLTVEAMSGGLDSGSVSIHKMGGEIDVENAPEGADLSTMGGNIHVNNVGSFARLKTMGGDIDVDHASGSIDAKTMGGAITISHANGPVHASTMAGDVTVHMNGASTQERAIDLSSMAGTILVTVPKDFGMDVRIKLTYTKNTDGKFRIDQHLGLTERQTTDWDTSHGSARKVMYATGRVGNGMNHVTIETINGDVILKQE